MLITQTILKWHQFLESRDIHVLEDILDVEVVFHSPDLYSPQKGKVITTLYLIGAIEVLGKPENNFAYYHQIQDKNIAVLEFKAEIGNIKIHGIDMIEINEVGKIINFTVMIRPLKAVHTVQEKMMELIEKMR